MTLEEKIEPALDKIAGLIAEQCKHGAQTTDVAPDYAACGQFIGPQARDRSQRGLHGTAAAIRVLAEANVSDARDLVPRLVAYVRDRERLFKERKEPLPENAFYDDQQNVIKLSEVLCALSYVQASHCHTDNIVQEIANKLLDARKEDKGWTFFLNSTASIHMLPTAFAIWALCRHGYDQRIEKQIDSLKARVLGGAHPIGDINESAVRIFCIFALTFRRNDLPETETRQLRAAFIALWRGHEAHLAQDVEQNIEYWNGPANYYVRIPWQIYLLALAGRLDPKRLASLAAKRRLNHILDAVNSSGFRYPYSGDSVSSRTNAILFDALEKIKRLETSTFFHALFYASDRLRTILGKPMVSLITLIIVLATALFCIFAWIRGRGKPEELGPELTVTVIVLLATNFIDRLRKPR